MMKLFEKFRYLAANSNPEFLYTVKSRKDMLRRSVLRNFIGISDIDRAQKTYQSFETSERRVLGASELISHTGHIPDGIKNDVEHLDMELSKKWLRNWSMVEIFKCGWDSRDLGKLIFDVEFQSEYYSSLSKGLFHPHGDQIDVWLGSKRNIPRFSGLSAEMQKTMFFIELFYITGEQEAYDEFVEIINKPLSELTTVEKIDLSDYAWKVCNNEADLRRTIALLHALNGDMNKRFVDIIPELLFCVAETGDWEYYRYCTTFFKTAVDKKDEIQFTDDVGWGYVLLAEKMMQQGNTDDVSLVSGELENPKYIADFREICRCRVKRVLRSRE
jgi:hypothetical protein